MDRTPEQIKADIDALRVELRRVSPAEDMSVRDIARIAGISPATAHRFKQGKSLDTKTVKSLISAGLILECPCCGRILSSEGRKALEEHD